jgi:hypothetical protein
MTETPGSGKRVPPPSTWSDEDLEAAKRLLAGEAPLAPPVSRRPNPAGLGAITAGLVLLLLAELVRGGWLSVALGILGAAAALYGYILLSRRPAGLPVDGGLRVGDMTFADRPELMLAVMEQQAVRQAGKVKDD